MDSGDTAYFEDLLDAIAASAEEVVFLVRTLHAGIPASVILQQLASLVERVPPALRHLLRGEADAVTLRSAAESLQGPLRRLRALVEDATLSGRSAASTVGRSIEGAARDLGKHLGLVLLAAEEAPENAKNAAARLHRELMEMRFQFLPLSASPPASPQPWGSPANAYKADGVTMDPEGVLARIKGGDVEEDLGTALEYLDGLVAGGLLWGDGENVVAVLLNRLRSAKRDNRLKIILLLRNLALQSEINKEKMADGESLSTIVRSLISDREESRQAVGLLLDLSDVPRARQRIGRVQGCIVVLVTLLNGDDNCASSDARNLLEVLSNNTQNVLLMTEAGYFKPLVRFLKRGSDMNRILMATTISRIGLTDQMKATLGDEGSIEPLVVMFTSGKLEAKLSSLSAIQKLCTSKTNAERLINAGIVEPLLQLLFSVTSVFVTLKEPASAILESLAGSELILKKKNVVPQMLSLLNLSSPTIQHHLLQALCRIADHPGAFKMRVKMKENGIVHLLIPFLSEDNSEIRGAALKLLFTLSKDWSDELTEKLGDIHLNVIGNIIATSKSQKEKADACGILSNISVGDKKATETLRKANLLPIIVTLLEKSLSASSVFINSLLIENTSGVLVRFTVPWDKKLQRTSTDMGLIPLLVKILLKASIIAQSRAASCLAQLSQNTLALCRVKSSRWMCVPAEALCEVHGCRCSIRGTLCIVKAGCVAPLIHILEGKEREADEAVLEALSTLVQDEIWERGSNFIEKTSGVQAIIRVLEVGSLKAQEKAIWMLERIFRVEDHRGKYGAAAQILLIDLAQRGDPILKPMIAKILVHLQLLPTQSSYF